MTCFLLQDYKILKQSDKTMIIQHKFKNTIQTLHMAKHKPCKIPIIHKTDSYIVVPFYPLKLKMILKNRKLSLYCIKTILKQIIELEDTKYTTDNIFLSDGEVKVDPFVAHSIDVYSSSSLVPGNVGSLAIEFLLNEDRKERIIILEDLCMNKVNIEGELGTFAQKALGSEWPNYVKNNYDGFFDGIGDLVPMAEIDVNYAEIPDSKDESKAKTKFNVSVYDEASHLRVKEVPYPLKDKIELFNNKTMDPQAHKQDKDVDNDIPSGNIILADSITKNDTAFSQSMKNKKVFKVTEYDKTLSDFPATQDNLASSCTNKIKTNYESEMHNVSSPCINNSESTHEFMKSSVQFCMNTNNGKHNKDSIDNLTNSIQGLRLPDEVPSNIKIKVEEVEYKKGRFTVKENTTVVNQCTNSDIQKMKKIITLQRELIYCLKSVNYRNQTRIMELENELNDLIGEEENSITGRGNTY